MMRVEQQNRAFYVGDALSGQPGAYARADQRKGLYQKGAMHAVTGVNRSEKRIDKSMDEIKQRIHMLMEENEEADAFLHEANRKMAQAKTDYDVDPDSQEEKDLDLLKKEYDIKKRRRFDKLTEEEERRLKEMGEHTEYQKLSMDLYAQADYWKYKMRDNQREIDCAGYVTRAIKIERLKTHAMVDAGKAKEEMMESASKEAVGMLRSEAVKAVDEKAERVEEAAKERNAAKEEQKERIEAAEAKKEEAEAGAKAVRENTPGMTEDIVKGSKTVREIDAEIKKVLEEEKLLEEELKGLRINAGV